MGNIDLTAPAPGAHVALVIRTALGILYMSHALLVCTIWAPDFIAAAELLGGAMLLLNLRARAAAAGLFPIAIVAAQTYSHAQLGMSLAYLAVCLAGQALLASGLLIRSSILEDFSQ